MAITHNYGNFDTHFKKDQDEIDDDGILTVSKSSREKAKFPEYLPSWDPKEKYPPLKPFKHIDPGLRAHPELLNLFPNDSYHKLKKITPKFGTEVSGIQLSTLSDKAKDDLAAFVAQRGVVVFRNQDFGERGPQFAVDYGKYFGRLHIHPTSGHPRNYPELHITYRRPDPGEFDRAFANRTSNVIWHSDVSYELQPPGVTFFSVLDGPESGGDTIFADSVEAYNRLSPAFQKRIEGLHVLHTSEDQATNARNYGGVERRKPVSHIHPLVRVHPVTGKKSLYLNKTFGRQIVELKREESDSLLGFLVSHIEESHDLQLRARWEPNTVVIWDNRRTIHSAIVDWEQPVSRHAFRITPQAERPIADLNDLNVKDA